MRLHENFTAVVTGGASGLGRALSVELGSRQGRVIVSDVDSEGAQGTAELVRQAGGEAWVIPCDVGQWQEVEALAEQTRQAVGEVDLIVNNAGVGVGGHFGEIPLEDWRWQMDVNLWGVIHGCRAFVPAMKARRRGWVMNIASAAGFACPAQFAPYNVAKAGVIALSETLRAELEPLGIDVTVVCPSYFQTNIAESGRGQDDAARDLIGELMHASKVQAADVASHSIESLERGRLHALPMRDARAAWLAKRAFPGSFHRAMNLARRAVERRSEARR